MKTLAFRFLIWAFFCLCTLRAQTAISYSDVCGFSIVNALIGGRVIVPVFVKSAVYSSLSNITNNSFTVTDLVTPLSPTSFTDRPNYPRYYVEITSGVYEGQRFDVSSNTSSNVYVYNLPNYLNNQTNVPISIRPHFTLSDLVQITPGLTEYSDTITFYFLNQVNSYIYTSSGFVSAEDYTTPMGQVVIYPGNGAVLCVASQAALTFYGQVKSTKTIVPVYCGVNIVAPIDPQGSNTISVASVLDPYSDTMTYVSIDGSLTLKPFYSDGINLLNENYSPTTSPLLETGNGVILNVATDRYWTSLSIVNQ